jgi:hypothetical protein
MSNVSYPMRFRISKQAPRQYIGIIPTIVKIVAWIGLLWGWATLLEYAPDALDIAILLVSAVPAIIFFWKKPAYGIISLMFFTSGFLAPDIVDIRLPLVGGFELRDILMMVMLLLSIFRRLSMRHVPIPWWPVGGLLLAFMLMMVFSAVYAIGFEGGAKNWALSDARILLFYAVFFITAWNITNKESLYILVIGSFVIADMMAAIVLIQQKLGPYNYLLISMEDPSWQIWEQVGSTRVVPPGIIYMYFMMLISLGLTIYWNIDFQKTLLWIFHTVFLGAGLIFTFTRSAWVATGIAILLMIILMYPTYKPVLGRVAVIVGATALFLIGSLGLIYDNYAVDNPAVKAIFERFTSIFTVEDTLETNSLQWRMFENQEATKAILEHPLTGVGLGNSYRDLTVFQGEAQGQWTDGDISYKRIDRFTRYVHSSYYALTVKMGIPALLIFLAFCFASIFKSIRLYYRLPNGLAKGVSLAIGTGMVGLMQWSFLHAHLILAASTAVIGLMIGMLAAVHYLYVIEPQDYTIF